MSYKDVVYENLFESLNKSSEEDFITHFLILFNKLVSDNKRRLKPLEESSLKYTGLTTQKLFEIEDSFKNGATWDAGYSYYLVNAYFNYFRSGTMSISDVDQSLREEICLNLRQIILYFTSKVEKIDNDLHIASIDRYFKLYRNENHYFCSVLVPVKEVFEFDRQSQVFLLLQALAEKYNRQNINRRSKVIVLKLYELALFFDVKLKKHKPEWVSTFLSNKEINIKVQKEIVKNLIKNTTDKVPPLKEYFDTPKTNLDNTQASIVFCLGEGKR